MGNIRPLYIIILIIGIVLAFAVTAYAGPPFLTDDPEPVPFKHWEIFLFSTVDATHNNTNATGPAVEFNVGALPNLQITLFVPFDLSSPAGGPSAYGIGDLEFSMKYRFIQETDNRPMVAVYPAIVIPTGDAARGLGNGQAWWRFPLWLQKSWGPWTTYGGGGYALNPAPAERNYFFGGWLLQRDLGEKLTLGGEIFAQGKSSNDVRSFAVFNLGGIVKITPNFHLVFSGGHSLAGGGHTIGYLGLYWTGGFGEGRRIHSGPKSLSSPAIVR